MSYLIEAGEYHRVLIVSSEVGSLGLSPKQKKVLNSLVTEQQPLSSKQVLKTKGLLQVFKHTWSEGAHDTEIRGGLTSYHPKKYSEKTKTDFMFDMKGKKILLLSAHKLPDMFQEFQRENSLSPNRCGTISFPIKLAVPYLWLWINWHCRRPIP